MATNSEIRELIKQELPAMMREDPSLREYVIGLTRDLYADKPKTEDRFDRILNELRDDRIAQSLKWEEQKEADRLLREEEARKWEDQKERDRLAREEEARKWEDQKERDRLAREEEARKWEDQKERDRLAREEQARKWEDQKESDRLAREEQARKWEEQKEADRLLREDQAGKWEEQKERDRLSREEQASKWEEQNESENRRFDRVHEEIMAQAKKYDRSIGALGARWGVQSERAFRDALAGILEESFGVEVLNVTEYDDAGEVFGRPDQVELDVIVRNGTLLICELKSSIDKAGMYIFERKARFYEKRHGRTANRLIVVSPMIDAKARKVADKLGIELYPDSLDVEAL
jgi:hypothetical protein